MNKQVRAGQDGNKQGPPKVVIIERVKLVTIRQQEMNERKVETSRFDCRRGVFVGRFARVPFLV